MGGDGNEPGGGTGRHGAWYYAERRDWAPYYEIIAGRGPRETLLWALERFDAEPAPESPPLAIDLGCGEGRDTAELLRRGWRVLAIDAAPGAIERLSARSDLVHPERLSTEAGSFSDADLPRARLVNASFALPFCSESEFDRVWPRIEAAILPGGRFAGQFLGVRDSWAGRAGWSHHTRTDVERLLSQFEIEDFEEDERNAQDEAGYTKHWHIFHVVARRPAG